MRHLAKKDNIDINQITGTGKGGRVTKTDLINYMSGPKKSKSGKEASSSSDSDSDSEK